MEQRIKCFPSTTTTTRINPKIINYWYHGGWQRVILTDSFQLKGYNDNSASLFWKVPRLKCIKSTPAGQESSQHLQIKCHSVGGQVEKSKVAYGAQLEIRKLRKKIFGSCLPKHERNFERRHGTVQSHLLGADFAEPPSQRSSNAE